MATTNEKAFENLLEKVKTAIKKRGEGGIKDLQRTFRIYDDDGSHKLSKEEFRKGLGDYGLRLTKGEIDILFAKFDANKDGGISFDEFLVTIRGQLNPARRALVKKAFDKLDKTKDGVIQLVDIQGTYNARKHPKVLSGELTENEALQLFLGNFDGNKDGTVTREEFEEYYAGVSATIDDDAYFSLMMYNAWKL